MASSRVRVPLKLWLLSMGNISYPAKTRERYTKFHHLWTKIFQNNVATVQLNYKILLHTVEAEHIRA